MSNQQPLISIIIACHNVVNYIDIALASCFSQTYKNIEVILVENGSTDDSWNYCKELSRKYSGMVFAYQSDASLFAGGARNFGIKKARGEYLTFLDDDDTFYPHAMKTLLDYCLKHDLEVAVGSVNRIEPPIDFRIAKERQSGIFIDDGRISLYILSASAKLYKTSFIRAFDIKFDTTRLAQDNMFYILNKLLAKKIGVLSFLTEPIYTYTIHPDSSILTGDKHYRSIVDVSMNMIDDFEKRVTIEEQRQRMTGSFYGTDLEQAVLSEACHNIVSNFNNNMKFFTNKLSQEGRDNVDKYLLENNVFDKVTAFEHKYGLKESPKRYYHQIQEPLQKPLQEPPIRHGIIRKIILRALRFITKILSKVVKFIKNLDNQIARL